MPTKKTDSSPRKSKLDACVHLIGTVPDKEVAERAGVTAENVRTYRIRRGIPASWRGETATELARKQSARRKSRRRSEPTEPGPCFGWPAYL